MKEGIDKDDGTGEAPQCQLGIDGVCIGGVGKLI